MSKTERSVISLQDKKIHIRIEHTSDLSSKITSNGETFIINTEVEGRESPEVCCRVFSNGRIILTKKKDTSHLKESDDFYRDLDRFMIQMHNSLIDQFSETLKQSQGKRSDYLNKAMSLLKQGKDREAFEMIKDGLRYFPEDLLLLSYYGYLCSHAARKSREGIRVCRDVISRLDGLDSMNRELLHPIFYLNLGRAYLGANKKREALRAFSIGLKADPENTSIALEMQRLGTRKKPVISFLPRGNPVNKYLGMFLNKYRN